MARTVLVTGGAGFIGRRLCQELLEHGYGVRVLDAMVEQAHGPARRSQPLDELNQVELLCGDLRNKTLVAQALKGIDAVVHLAAEVGVGQSMYEIARYVGANDLGTACLLEGLIAHPVERIIVASSMSVYGEGAYRTADGAMALQVERKAAAIRAGQWEPVDAQGRSLTPVPTPETKQTDLASIYALTKYVQERAVLIFGAAYGMQAVALRLFNVYGPGQALSNPYTGVLANFASRLMNAQPPLVFENGLQRRDFVHVRDVARAFRLALEKDGLDGQTINIASGRSSSIIQIAELLAAALGVAIKPEILNKARSGDIRHCFADIAKAERLMAFAPRFTLEDSIGEFAQWVRTNEAQDHSARMRKELEARGLVA